MPPHLKEARHEPRVPGFMPWRIFDVEIGQPLPPLPAADPATGQIYQRALILVRLHTQPLGIVEVCLGPHGLTADHYAQQIWRGISTQIITHLCQDGMLVPPGLDAAGLPSAGTAACLQERQAFLAHAPFASVVVATHNRPAGLSACLASLQALDYPAYEIIVVDNAPLTDEALHVVRRSGGPAPVRYVREDCPGLSRAHNCGLQEVTAPIVAFTDDDVLVDQHWLTELVRGFDAAAHVGCVTGMIFPAELHTPSQVWIEQYGGFGKGYVQRVFNLAAQRPADPLYPYTAGTFGSGANMAFRTAALRQIGAFAPALGAGSAALGGDDLAAFFGIVAAGYTLVYHPSAIVRHWHRRDYAGLRRQVYGYGVGLTAYLTKILVDRPGRLLDIAIRIPYGLAYALSPRSPKNRRKQADYPRELTAIERRGMLYGPIAYLRALWQVHHMPPASPHSPPTLGRISASTPDQSSNR